MTHAKSGTNKRNEKLSRSIFNDLILNLLVHRVKVFKEMARIKSLKPIHTQLSTPNYSILSVFINYLKCKISQRIVKLCAFIRVFHMPCVLCVCKLELKNNEQSQYTPNRYIARNLLNCIYIYMNFLLLYISSFALIFQLQFQLLFLAPSLRISSCIHVSI